MFVAEAVTRTRDHWVLPKPIGRSNELVSNNLKAYKICQFVALKKKSHYYSLLFLRKRRLKKYPFAKTFRQAERGDKIKRYFGYKNFGLAVLQKYFSLYRKNDEEKSIRHGLSQHFAETEFSATLP